MKKILIIAALIANGVAFGQANILDARSYSVGSTVTVSGVVTNGSELGSIRYMQDGTGGIAAYGSAINSVQRYDSITVTGQISEFSGLLEISPITNVVNHGAAVVQPQPIEIPLTAASEALEAQYIVVHNVTFTSTGVFGGNQTYQVTDGSNLLDVRINTTTNIDGTSIPTTPVSIYGLEGQFNANYQIVPRALADIVPYVAPEKEINVMIAGGTVLTGTNYFIGNSTATTVTIQNLGTGDLTLSGASFAGTNAADFSSDIVAGVIAGGSSGTYTVNFAPSGTGTRVATLNIGSDDPDENPYVINFEGVGTDDLATEPSANPTNLSFSNVKAYTLSGSYTAGSGATKYLVLWKNGSAVTEMPVDGTTYMRGDVIGGARVAYVGSATGFTPRGIIANQNYNFAVYAFNGQGGFENYLTTGGLTGSVTSGGDEINTYYNGINTNATSFVTDLTNLVNPHTFISYFNYKQTMMNEFEVKDTTNGESFVTCVYSGDRTTFSGPFDWTAADYSREHVFAHSWMPTYPADSPEQKEYTDQHNLQPVKFSNVNAVRSNYPLGNVVTVQSSYLGSKIGLDANGNKVFEPRDEMKGNVARSMMYMAVAYNGTGGATWAFPDYISFIIPYGQDPDVIVQWHFQDLPDNYEIARNEYVYHTQGNRNPFIDSVDYACYVDFSNMTHKANGCNVGVEELLNDRLTVYPVPASDVVYAQMDGMSIEGYSLVDLQGRVVETRSELNTLVVEIDAARLVPGTYMLRIMTAKGEAQRKIVIN